MKKCNILTSFLCMLLIYACNDTTFDEYNKTKVEENIPASVVLDFSALENQIHTRAVSDEATEKALNNLYVFIFNSNGTKATGKYFDKAMLTGSTLSIDTYSGSGKQVFAVANFELNKMMSLEKKYLDDITTKEQLMDMNAHLLQKITSRGSSFLMTGCIESEGQPANIDIIPGNNPISLGTIKLRRVDAKVQFNIKAQGDAEFTLKEWKVEQLPLNVKLFNPTENYFDGSNNFSTGWKKPEGEGDNLGKTFSFYVLEHLRAPKNKIKLTDSWTDYALREKNPENWIREDKELPSNVTANDKFVFADDLATYVVFKGYIKYKKKLENEKIVPVEGDVTYTVHLGYSKIVVYNEDNEAEEIDNPNDYNVKRNSFYTYNINIYSADRVIVEVVNKEEQHPGAEGNLTVGGTNLRFDAHYETTMVEFKKEDITNNLTWYVNTPFDNGFASADRKDYKWILFRLNGKTDDKYRTDFVSFSGLQNLYTGDLNAASYLNNKDKLINVDQLVAILKSEKETNSTLFDSEGNVRFTAFVQEYYYDKTPGSNGAFEQTLWKKFVNAPERVMNILSYKAYSDDENSMCSKVFYSIRQASIQTMYNNDELVADLKTAWGSEMIQDKRQMNFYPNGDKQEVNSDWKSPYSSSNGRKNTIELWKNDISKKWSTYVNPANATMNSRYNIAKYACMQRNRDLDGNNQIDKDEIRWYLAALDQLTDLWIGEQSFDSEAYLYKPKLGIVTTDSPWGEMWYVSSTINQIKIRTGGVIIPQYTYYADPTVLWSSEGASVGQLNGVPSGGYRKLSYRCLRNLGIDASNDASNETDVPDPIGKYTEATGVISLSSLDPNSIRDDFTINELPEHHEREKVNLPYRSFEVSKTVSGRNKTWVDVRNSIRNNKSPCESLDGEGWRVPNQRELALMLSLIGNDKNWIYDDNILFFGYHMSRTRFSMNPDGETRYGFSIRKQGELLFLIHSLDEKGGVRCVRDKK